MYVHQKRNQVFLEKMIFWPEFPVKVYYTVNYEHLNGHVIEIDQSDVCMCATNKHVIEIDQSELLSVYHDAPRFKSANHVPQLMRKVRRLGISWDFETNLGLDLLFFFT